MNEMLDKRHFESFRRIVIANIEAMFGKICAKKGAVKLTNGVRPAHELVFMVEASGTASFRYFLTMSPQVLLQLHSREGSWDQLTREDKDEAMAAMCELGNVAIGETSVDLENDYPDLTLGLPMSFHLRDKEDFHYSETACYNSYLSCGEGQIQLILAWDFRSITIADRKAEMEDMANDLKEKAQELASLVGTDELTGASNVRQYNRDIIRFIRESEIHGMGFSLLLMDMDKFKELNDTQGHRKGDEALCSLVQAVKLSVRRGDECYRFGGDEFLVVLPGAKEEHGIQSAERVAEKFRELFGKANDCSLSAGVVQYSSGDTPAKVFEKADAAMYRVKDRGGDDVFAHSKL